jgi:hypothetical protein
VLFSSPLKITSFLISAVGINTKTCYGIALHSIFLLFPLMPGYPFGNDHLQETRLTSTIRVKDIVGGTFITIVVKYRTGKIDFQEINGSVSVYPEIQPGIPYPTETFENIFGSFFKIDLPGGSSATAIFAFGMQFGCFQGIGFKCSVLPGKMYSTGLKTVTD